MPHTPQTSPPRAAIALIVTAATLLFTLPTPEAHAGGWTQDAGAYYAKIWNRALIGSGAFYADGEVQEVAAYQDFLLNIYAEYGITDSLTAVAFSSPVGYAKYDKTSTAYTGVNFLGARYGLLKGSLPIAVEVHYGFTPAVGDKDLAVDDMTLEYRPTLSGQRADAELQLGYALPGGWATLAAGGRYQSADSIDPALYANGQIGYSTSFGLVADLHVGLLEPIGDVDATNVSGAGQTRYLGIGVGLSYWISDSFGVNVGFDGVAYASSNAATPSLTVGVELK